MTIHPTSPSSTLAERLRPALSHFFYLSCLLRSPLRFPRVRLRVCLSCSCRSTDQFQQLCKKASHSCVPYSRNLRIHMHTSTTTDLLLVYCWTKAICLLRVGGPLFFSRRRKRRSWLRRLDRRPVFTLEPAISSSGGGGAGQEVIQQRQ